MDEFERCTVVVIKNDPYRDYALQVKQACVSAGVPIIYIGYYIRFGREVWSLKVRRGLTGETLATEVAIRVAKWKHLGLSLAMLQAIAFDVFTIKVAD